MPKTKKLTNSSGVKLSQFRQWSCSQFGDESEIDVFVEATNSWVTVARVYPVLGIDAEEIANFFINNFKSNVSQ